MNPKFYLSVIAFVFSVEFMMAQTVDGVALDQLEVEYLQIIGTGRAFHANMHVTIDYGQENTSIQRRGHPILDEKGEQIIFNSMMQALNYVSSFGYELVASKIAVSSSDIQTFYYVLKRRY